MSPEVQLVLIVLAFCGGLALWVVTAIHAEAVRRPFLTSFAELWIPQSWHSPRAVHRLKTWPEYFEAARSGSKPFEIRIADRDFRVGDALELEEWRPDTSAYTGRRLRRRITFIVRGGQFGLDDGYVVLALRRRWPAV